MLPVKTVTALRRSAPSPTLRPDRLRLTLSVEQLMLTASLFFALTANRAFFAATLKDRSATDPTAWGFGAAMFVLVLGLHLLLMALVAHRHTIKPLLVVLILGTAFATYYMGAFGVYLDPSMLRNVMRTDVKEASELFNPEMLRHVLLQGGLPLLSSGESACGPQRPTHGGGGPWHCAQGWCWARWPRWQAACCWCSSPSPR